MLEKNNMEIAAVISRWLDKSMLGKAGKGP
jgi:hypothetical protein